MLEVHTRYLHVAMSAALPFVHDISHKVKTCVSSKFYPITMRKIVLTSSARWLADVIKNVMSSIVQSQDHCDLPKRGTAWPVAPAVPTWLRVTFGCSPLIKEKLAGGNIPRI